MQTLAELGCLPAVTIGPEESLDAALARLLQSAATELFVIAADDRLLGIVPDYELLKAKLSGSWSELTVAQVMSHRLLCFTPETTVAAVLRAFREGQHSRAAVVESGRLVGQITRTVLLQTLAHSRPSPVPVAPPKFLQAPGMTARQPA